MNSCREDSIKFNNMIDDEEIRNIYVNIADFKFNQYSKSDSQYIKYVAYKDSNK